MKIRDYIQGKKEIFEEQLKEFSNAFLEEFPKDIEMDIDTFEEMFYAFVEGVEEPDEDFDPDLPEETSTAEEVTDEPTAVATLPVPGALLPQETNTVVSQEVAGEQPKLQVDPDEAKRIEAALAAQTAEEKPSVVLKPHEKKAIEKIKKRKREESQES